ncbi:hypothetical protein GGI13_004926 [Coemansia sp. RSA 455]|nr:hypothetical protein GGI14_000148 [Coemansia sp. S680]KAJ2027680.1 hypothetical protein H4S03_008154 [Coemansia sp. S3946]KAJ2053222.1 hypothetical protein H4S04_000831 [Coemansia sp. S16]KAJ2115798.1 hypothetical protein IW146_002017 [Coemansia sp. RSA 922]KAJ2247765.1 hypothetical protein GGI13_004926 [Coemansia sp. RSA 455]
MVDTVHSAAQALQAHSRTAELKQSPRPRASTTASAAGTPQQPWRGRDVVFVDPLDSSVPYWWPAMIVPTDEIDATMGCTSLGPEECLVKYFEDFKYSTVNGSELRIFDTSQPPFTDFAKKSTSFLRDKAIKGALSYLKTGHVHTRFQWRLWMTGSETLRLPFVLSSEPTLFFTPTTAMLPDQLGSSKASPPRNDHLSSPLSSPPLPALALVSAAESDVSTLVSAAALAIVTDDDSNHASARSLPASPGGLTRRLASESDHHHEPLHRSASPARAASRSSKLSASGGAHYQCGRRQQQHTPRSTTTTTSRRRNPTPPPKGPSESPNPSDDTKGEDDEDDGPGNGGGNDGDGDDDGDDDNNEPEDAQGDDEDEEEDEDGAQPQILQPPHIISKNSSQPVSTPESTARTSPEPTPLPTTAMAGKRRSNLQRHTQPTSQPKSAKRGRPPLSSNRQKPPARQQQQSKRKAVNSSPVASAWISDVSPGDQLQDPPSEESAAIQDIMRDMQEAQEEYKFFKSLVRNAAKDLWLEMGNEWPPNIGTSTRFGKRRKAA